MQKKWIVIGMIATVFLGAVCGSAVVWYLAKNGATAVAGKQQVVAEPGKIRLEVVGSWEAVGGIMGHFWEFNRNGSGSTFTKHFAIIEPDENKGKWRKEIFKWHVEGEKKPILILEKADFKSHFYYTIEEDTLTLTDMQVAQLGAPGLIFRRAKSLPK